MKGRPNIYQDEELILKAQELFWRQGYNATSLSDLSNATGAGAGSLYNSFKGGKKELFSRALQQRREELNAFRKVVEKSKRPIALIKKFFLEIADADPISHQKGCIVANTIVEMSFVDDELKQEAAQILKETEMFYCEVIAREQDNGNICSKLPATVLAQHLITFWCGINSLRRIYPDKKVLRTQINLQLELIN